MKIDKDIYSLIEKYKEIKSFCVVEICITDRMKGNYLIAQKYLVLTNETYNYIINNKKESFYNIIKEIPVFFDDKKIEDYLKVCYSSDFPFTSIINKPIKWE